MSRLKSVRDQHGDGLPIVCAGDVFDRWDAPAELINLVIRECPVIHAIPGQHDLPHHNYEERRRSAYWTLVEAGKLVHLRPGKPYKIGKLVLHPFPWGYDLKEIPEDARRDVVNLAVCHKYLWKEGHEHPGARREDHVDSYEWGRLGYDAALFGDNHRGFYKSGDFEVYNHGTLMRRRSDERTYQPTYGVLYTNGGIVCHPFECRPEKWVEESAIPEAKEYGVDAEELVALLRDLGDHALSFRDALTQFLRNKVVVDTVRTKVVEWLESLGRK